MLTLPGLPASVRDLGGIKVKILSIALLLFICTVGIVGGIAFVILAFMGFFNPLIGG